MVYQLAVAATVYERAGVWYLDLEGPDTSILEHVATSWDGAGRFNDEGLNVIAPLLDARGLVYQRWQRSDDRFVATVYPKVVRPR